MLGTWRHGRQNFWRGTRRGVHPIDGAEEQRPHVGGAERGGPLGDEPLERGVEALDQRPVGRPEEREVGLPPLHDPGDALEVGEGRQRRTRPGERRRGVGLRERQRRAKPDVRLAPELAEIEIADVVVGVVQPLLASVKKTVGTPTATRFT
jgi:hypothetical protein